MTKAPPDSPRRRPKGDKRARTRAALLEAAQRLIWEQGYEAVTMAEVARRAGMSNGAIYGNFRDRDELISSLGPAYWPRVRVQAKPGATFPELMRAVSEALISVLPLRVQRVRDRLTGLAYGMKNPGSMERSREIAVEGYAAAAAWWRSAIGEDELPMSPETLVRVINALTEGLTIQRALTPDLIPDEVIHAAFDALAKAAPKR